MEERRSRQRMLTFSVSVRGYDVRFSERRAYTQPVFSQVYRQDESISAQERVRFTPPKVKSGLDVAAEL